MERKDNDSFCINVYSPGNLIARDITFSGTVYFNGKPNDCYGYTDEQIAQAITAINGKGKPLNTKRKWAAVHWCLRWYCNFPPKAANFVARVEKLPLGQLEYECEYDSFRHLSTLSFLEQDARQMDKVKPSKNELGYFKEFREVVLALASELGKAALPTLPM